MRVGERVSKHRAARREKGLVRVEVVVPAEMAEQVKRLALRLRSRRAKVDISQVRMLIAEAFEKYRASCLDNIEVSPAQAGIRHARVVADALMKRGSKDAFVLGRRILEQARL